MSLYDFEAFKAVSQTTYPVTARSKGYRPIDTSGFRGLPGPLSDDISPSMELSAAASAALKAGNRARNGSYWIPLAVWAKLPPEVRGELLVSGAGVQGAGAGFGGFRHESPWEDFRVGLDAHAAMAPGSFAKLYPADGATAVYQTVYATLQRTDKREFDRLHKAIEAGEVERLPDPIPPPIHDISHPDRAENMRFVRAGQTVEAHEKKIAAIEEELANDPRQRLKEAKSQKFDLEVLNAPDTEKNEAESAAGQQAADSNSE